MANLTNSDELAELIQRQLAGNSDVSDDFGTLRIELKKTIGQVQAKLINDEYIQSLNRTGNGNVNNSWLRTYKNVVVKTDKELKKKYCDLPVSVVTLPEDRGIYMVAPMQGQSQPFIRQGAFGEWLFESSPVINTKFSLDNDRVYFTNLHPFVKEVMMKLVPVADDFLQDDNALAIRETVVKLYLQTKAVPQDKINDNADETNK